MRTTTKLAAVMAALATALAGLLIIAVTAAPAQAKAGSVTLKAPDGVLYTGSFGCSYHHLKVVVDLPARAKELQGTLRVWAAGQDQTTQPVTSTGITEANPEDGTKKLKVQFCNGNTPGDYVARFTSGWRDGDGYMHDFAPRQKTFHMRKPKIRMRISVADKTPKVGGKVGIRGKVVEETRSGWRPIPFGYGVLQVRRKDGWSSVTELQPIDSDGKVRWGKWKKSYGARTADIRVSGRDILDKPRVNSRAVEVRPHR